jgi:hypothetical protein
VDPLQGEQIVCRGFLDATNALNGGLRPFL